MLFHITRREVIIFHADIDLKVVNGNDGAVPGLQVARLNVASVSPDGIEGNRQTQACAVAAIGRKRFKQAIHHVRSDPASLIDDVDGNLILLFMHRKVVQKWLGERIGRMTGNRMARRSTGRVVATGRAVLALAFLLALWLDPSVPVRGANLGYALLNIYTLWTAALMVIAWRSWWFDFRLAPLAQGLDIAMFLAAVYFRSEEHTSELQSH